MKLMRAIYAAQPMPEGARCIADCSGAPINRKFYKYSYSMNLISGFGCRFVFPENFYFKKIKGEGYEGDYRALYVVGDLPTELEMEEFRDKCRKLEAIDPQKFYEKAKEHYILSPPIK